MISKLILGLFLFTCLLGGCQCPQNPLGPTDTSNPGPAGSNIVYSANYDSLPSTGASIPASDPESWTASNGSTTATFQAGGSPYPSHSYPNSMSVNMSSSSNGGAYSKSFSLNTSRNVILDFYTESNASSSVSPGIYLVSNGIKVAGVSFYNNGSSNQFISIQGNTIASISNYSAGMAHFTFVWHPSANTVDYYFKGTLIKTEPVGYTADLVPGTHLSFVQSSGTWQAYFDDLVVTN